jgi:hypothetical protein
VFATGSSSSGKVGKNAVSVWTTRRSLDGGATWANVDLGPSGGQGLAIGADASGNLYAVGPLT